MIAIIRTAALTLSLIAPHHHHHRPKPRWNTSEASEYGEGDGQMGGPLACGGTLESRTIEVANRWLPCGTMVTFRIGGRQARVPVRDRGPYCCGRDWDLSAALARHLRLAYPWSGQIAWHLG